jgi:hypothetical protein
VRSWSERAVGRVYPRAPSAVALKLIPSSAALNHEFCS